MSGSDSPPAGRTPGTIPELLGIQAAEAPAAPAILAAGRAALDHGALLRQVEEAAGVLRRAGARPGARIALVVGEGPEAATAFLAAACAGTAAPLNPAYRGDELTFLLDDLRPCVLVVTAGLETPARALARSLSIPILELHATGDAAGAFRLVAESPDIAAGPAEVPVSGPDDVALVLHTSGTTSRPKQVPLTHANLLASAANVAATLGLGPADRCLNIMPLFHIHGLVAALLASLRAGGSVACTPGLRAGRFRAWLDEMQATWYTAVPTLHQAILAEADGAGDGAGRLRFIRSSSSALPQRTRAELEERFGVPVIEAYGMTEAAHQIASNPLPPGGRKPGSVGRAAGPEVAIMDATGRLLGPGATGEVVIRGKNVTAGYVAGPALNAAAFTDGWFRTGDEGRLDGDGYLFLTGRLKEQINRGGEKIAPLEVDEVLMSHPAVQQVVTFALPHVTLGEDVAAAVVVRPGAAATERQLREYAAQRLAYYKVPRRIVFVRAIPKGPTGKPQRIGLSERLGLEAGPAASPARGGPAAPGSDPAGGQASPDDVGGPPGDPVEEIVAAVWAEVLGSAPAGVHQDFFRAGGDSLRATQLVARLREELRVELSLLTFFDAPTVAGVSAELAPLLEE